MSDILKVKVEGQWISIPAIKGDNGQGIPTGGTTGQFLKKRSNTDYDTEWSNSSVSTSWGDINGTLSNQTDLQSVLDTKASLNGDQTQNFAVKSALNQANNTYAVNKADLDTMVGNITTLLETI